MAKVESQGVVITLTTKEAIALSKLIGNMSQRKMIEVANLTSQQADLISEIYYVLSDEVQNKDAN